MSARRPTAPHAGGRTTGSGAPGRAGAPHPGGTRAAGTGPASTRPDSRATGPATSSAGRGAAGVDRVQVAATRLPRLFTVRALVLFVVGLLAFVLLFPTVRAYLAQQADNARLAQHVAQARAENDDLTAELERWNDPAYVAAQARERLAFVLPGETAFRVVDPETVPDPTALAVPAVGSGPALVPEGTTTPWYTTIWESVRVAGEADVPASEPAADPPADPAVDPAATAPADPAMP